MIPPEIQWILNLVITLGVAGMVKWVHGLQKDVNNFKIHVAEKYASKEDIREIIQAAIKPVSNDVGWIKERMARLEDRHDDR